MERFVDVDWDDEKSAKLKRERGFSLSDAAEVLLGQCVERTKNDEPWQGIAIGYAQGELLTLVYEIRENEEGISYYWLITYWPSTKSERRIYEKEFR